MEKKSGGVELIAPKDAAPVAGTAPFSWEPQQHAAGYRLEVYRNNDTTYSSANLVLGVDTKLAYVATKYLPASATPYLWRVRWLDGDSHVGAWSAPGRFFVHQRVVPQVSPGIGAYQPAAGPYFTWKPVPSAVKYYVEARKVGTTSSTVKITTVAQAAAASTTFIDGDYEWHVTAYDPSGGVLAQSIWRGFKVDTTKPIVTSKTPVGNGSLGRQLRGHVQREGQGRERVDDAAAGLGQYDTRACRGDPVRRWQDGDAEPDCEPGPRQGLHGLVHERDQGHGREPTDLALVEGHRPVA